MSLWEEWGWHLHVDWELDLACSVVNGHGYLSDCGAWHLKEGLRIENGLLLLLLILGFLALNFLLKCDHFSHLLNRNRTLYINPLVENRVSISKLQNKIDTANVCKSDKAKSSWLPCSLVLQNNAIFDFSKVVKIFSKLRDLQIVRKSSDENLSKLSIDLVSWFKTLHPQLV